MRVFLSRAVSVAALCLLCVAARPALPADIEAGEDAVVLEDSIEIDIASETEARVRHVNRTRILTQHGADEYGQATIALNPWISVRDIRASVTSPQGKVVPVKKQSMWEGSYFASFELFADSKHRTIDFPAAAPGTVLEYDYETQVRNLYFLPLTFALQEEIPVRSRTITLRLPSTMGMRHLIRGTAPEYTHEEKDGRVTHRWQIHDVAAYKEERDMPPASDVVPALSIFLKEILWDTHRIDASTWNGIARWYWDLARDRMLPDEAVAQAAREITQGVTEPDDKIRRIYEFAQGKIEYVAIALGIGGYQPHASGHVLAHRYGDCKDKATLMIAMLRSIGLVGYPVLILTRDEGEVDRDYPSDDFNHVIVAVPRPDGYLFMDPTSTTTPFGDLPWSDQGANVLVVKEDGRGDLVQTPLLPPERNRRHRLVVASIDPEGKLTGTYVIDAWGQRRSSLSAFLESKPSERADDLASMMGWLTPGAILNAHEVTPPAGPGDPLRITIRFEVPRFVSRVGGMELVAPYLIRFPGLTEIGAYSGRRYPVFFDYLFTETSEVRLRLPAGKALKKLPSDRDATGAGLSAQTRHEIIRDGLYQTLVIRRTATVTRREIPVAEYPALREFLSGLAQEEAKAVSLDAAPRATSELIVPALPSPSGR
jgi:transglutaminase-like putative cysteine protease